MPNIPKYLREKPILEAIIPPAPSGIVVLDEYFHANKALLPLSTDLTDIMGNTWTANGNANVSGGFLNLDGAGDYLSCNKYSPGYLGDKEWTIEMFLTIGAASTDNKVLFDPRNANSPQPYVVAIKGSGNNYAPYVYDGTQERMSTGVLTVNVESHIAYVLKDGILSMYVDGTRVYNTANATVFSYSALPKIGWPFGGTGDLNGKIRGFRVTGVARYTGATVTVPTLPLPTSHS